MPVVEDSYTSSRKAMICKTAFVSKQFNLRGLESALHSLFQEICHDLTQSIDNLIPHIHDTLWLSWDDDKLEFNIYQSRQHLRLEEDDDDLMSVDNDDEDDGMNELGNLSLESDKTVQGRDIEGIPDLVIHHARTSDLQGDSLYVRRRAAVKLHHFCPFLISEFKSGPPRGLPEEELKLQITLYFAEGFQQLTRYLVWAFAVHPYLDEIIAMPVAGIYWYYVPVRRTDMPRYNWSTATFEDRGEVNRLLEKVEYFEVCTPASDAAFTRLLRDYFQPLGQDKLP